MSGKAKLISRKLLAGDEKVMFESRPSAVKYMVGAAIALLLSIGFLLISVWTRLPWDIEIPYLQDYLEGENTDIISIACLAIFVLLMLFFIARWARWSGTIYVITDERVMTKTGLISRNFEDMPLGMISSVDLSQKATHGLLGYGTVVFSAYGSTGRGKLVWKNVPDPLKVRRVAQEVMDTRPKG